MKPKLLTLGTSHMTDKHYNQSWHNQDCYNAYVHYDKGELRWTEYLASKLYLELQDLSLGSYGIDTYAQRLIASDAQVALIEMPDFNRFELFVNQSDTSQTLVKQFWQTDEHKKYIYKYTSGDYGEDHTRTDKFNSVNQSAEIPLTAQMIDNSIELLAVNNHRFQEDRIWATVLMCDGYLRSKNIPVYWFSWNFNLHHYDTSMLQGKLIHDRPLYERFTDDVIVDGSHLRSDLWRQLVDEVFIPGMQS